jgi:hypothetical protein
VYLRSSISLLTSEPARTSNNKRPAQVEQGFTCFFQSGAGFGIDDCVLSFSLIPNTADLLLNNDSPSDWNGAMQGDALRTVEHPTPVNFSDLSDSPPGTEANHYSLRRESLLLDSLGVIGGEFKF